MRVLIISEQQRLIPELETAVIESGHQLAAKVELQNGFVQRLAGQAADLIIMDIESVERSMLKELSLIAIPVVIFAAQQGEADSSAVLQSGVSAYVVDGFKKERVAALIELALARFNQMQALKMEISKTRQELEERKEVDRAKGIIMKQKGCSEADAYQALRKTAMDQNRRIGEVAKNIVSLADLLNC